MLLVLFVVIGGDEELFSRLDILSNCCQLLNKGLDYLWLEWDLMSGTILKDGLMEPLLVSLFILACVTLKDEVVQQDVEAISGLFHLLAHCGKQVAKTALLSDLK